MQTEVDLRELAIDRGGAGGSQIRTRRHVLSRFVLPAVLIAGFLSLLVWASWEYLFPPKDVTVVPVISTTAEVRREGTPLFKAAGWIEPRPTPVRVAALAPGVVEKLLVREDDVVKPGQKIALLVDEDAKLARDRARAERDLRAAELEQARADLKAAATRLKQPVHLKAALGEAEAALAKVQTQLTDLPFQLRRAEADTQAARKDYESNVASKGGVAGVETEISKSKWQSAAALVESLRRRKASLQGERDALAARRKAVQAQLELLIDEKRDEAIGRAKIKAAQARLDRAGVALAEAELRFKRMTVTSPIEGRVYRLIGHPGARLGSGGMTQSTGHDASTVVTLYRPDMLQIRVDVRFNDLLKVRLNQDVRITNPALSEPITGKVLFISSEADIQKNTLDVKVSLPNPPSVFKPEMLVDVTFLAPKTATQGSKPSKELKLYVPEQLVHREEGAAWVWVADQSAKVARKIEVKTASVAGSGLVEVTSGLTPSSRIISGGSDGLRDGDRIRVTGEDASFGSNNELTQAGNE